MKIAKRRPGGLPAALWMVLPQVTTRAASFYVFAAVARSVNADVLGSLTIGTAAGGVAVALAPAIVGKPLANTRDPELRREFGRLGASAATWMSMVAAVVLALVALATHGLTRVALLGAAIGLPSAMLIESLFWRWLFLESRRTAAVRYCSAYGTQVVLVTVSAFELDGSALVIATFASLAVPALVMAALNRDLSPVAAITWARRHSDLWLPYVIGTIAAVALVQLIPIVLTATAGFQDAGVYRAGELAFGVTNLAIGISLQNLIIRDPGGERRLYLRYSAVLAGVAVLNGVILMLLPDALLHLVFGAVAPLLVAVLLITTVQRTAMSISSVGATLLIPHLSARRIGALDFVSAVVQLTALLVGAATDGLRGGLTGLAIAEIVLAVTAFVLLRRSSAARVPLDAPVDAA